MPRRNHPKHTRKAQKTIYNPNHGRKQSGTYDGPQEEYEYGF